jgi:hypothetical protein
MPWYWWYAAPTIPNYHPCGGSHALVLGSDIFPIGCYDISNGRPVNCHEDWREYFSTEGVTDPDQLLYWQGGHTHSRSGDVTTTTGGIYSDLSPDDAPSAIVGDTGNIIWSGYKFHPEGSGVVRISVHGTFPPNYRLVPDDCWRVDPNIPYGRGFWSEMAVSIGVFGLIELPSDPSYSINRGNTGNHPKGSYVAPAMAGRLAQLAQQYRDWYHTAKGQWVQISFNDMSLPWGGVFDLNEDWHCPHLLHRLGRSADVNRLTYILKWKLDKIAGAIGLVEKHTTGTLMHYELQ